MPNNNLRQDIIRKYKSLKSFSRHHDISYNKIMLVFNTKNCSSDDLALITNTFYKEGDIDIDGEIRDSDRKRIRLCILSNFNSYTDFYNKHKRYNPVYITNIVKGRLVKETVKYRNLVNLLTRDYGLQLND